MRNIRVTLSPPYKGGLFYCVIFLQNSAALDINCKRVLHDLFTAPVDLLTGNMVVVRSMHTKIFSIVRIACFVFYTELQYDPAGNVYVILAVRRKIRAKVKRKNIMVAKLVKDGAAILISQKQYAELVPGLTLQYVKFLCSPTCEKWRCAKRIDERDLKRFSKNKVMIWYQPSNPVSGKDRPRLLDREDPVRLDSDMLVRMDAKGRGAVLDGIEKAADEGRLFVEDEGEID